MGKYISSVTKLVKEKDIFLQRVEYNKSIKEYCPKTQCYYTVKFEYILKV